MKIRVRRGEGADVVFAMQWTGTNLEEMKAFATDGFKQEEDDPSARVFDRMGSGTWAAVRVGDWVIEGLFGEFYPFRQEDFASTWEIVEG
jgi:hypothetical protein